MSTPETGPKMTEPWSELEALAEHGSSESVRTFLTELPAGEVALSLSRVSVETRSRVIDLIGPEDSADLLESLSTVQAVEVLESLEPSEAAAVLDNLPSDEQADLLCDLDEINAAEVLSRMDPEQARDAEALCQYDDDVAGGLMVTEILVYPEGFTVSEVIDDMRERADQYRDYDVQYAYVTDSEGRLTGVLRLRDLLLAASDQRVSQLMIADPVNVDSQAPFDDLVALFQRHDYLGVPVTDATGRLVGVVRRDSVDEAVSEHQDHDYLKTQGIVGGEEIRTMPLLGRSRRRLSWLSINIVLNILAASIIAMFQDTLASVIALAVFLPIISDMSGCSGNQAVAVSMRELSLGLVRPQEVARVWVKEASLGAINGVVLGILIALVAYIWQGNAYLGLVVGLALCINTVVAVSLGGVVPLVLKRLNLDPAVASGPILTTVTDMCGFLLVLSLATAFISKLT